MSIPLERDHWNESYTMVNQREQAIRSARTIRGLVKPEPQEKEKAP